jgi:hypothetical protein
MEQPEPRQTREGRLIEEATKASGRSIRSLAANAGMSDTRWRHVMKGWQPGPGGTPIQVNPPAGTLAKMALVLGLEPIEVRKTGRADAADLMIRHLDADMLVHHPDGQISVVEVKNNRPPGMFDEIDLIARSKTMSAREKLEMIRLVLELRAQAEREERGQQKAPAPDDAGAPVKQPR